MNNKTWGGRFKKGLHPKAQAFNASLSFDYILYPFDIMGSKAHAMMLAKQGLITDKEAEVICQGLDEIQSELDADKIKLDATYEDIHMLIEHHLIQKIGDTGKKLHTGRSRNDQVALDLKLYVKTATNQCLVLLKDLIKVLRLFAKKYHRDAMPGYTHLQQAQPIFLGNWFGAYENMFQRDLKRYQEFIKRMNYSPLGAGALAGSRLPLDRKMMHRLHVHLFYSANKSMSIAEFFAIKKTLKAA